MKRRDLVTAIKGSGVVRRAGEAIDRAVPASSNLCTVLTFHRLDTGADDLYPGLASLRPDEFAAFVARLVDRYVPIDVDRFVAALGGATVLPKRAVLVTFDDAYRDFAEVAWPILAAHGAPAVLFVPTAYPDHPERQFWWDALFGALQRSTPDRRRELDLGEGAPAEVFRSLRAGVKDRPVDDADRFVRRLVDDLGGAEQRPPGAPTRVLSWGELSDLADAGVALAPHSRTHPMLDRLPDERLDDEISGSYHDMVERLGADRVRPVFAYPSGGHDPRVRAAVVRSGLTAAFTTSRGLVDLRTSDPVELPRLNVGQSSTVGAIGLEAAARRARSMARSAVSRRSG